MNMRLTVLWPAQMRSQMPVMEMYLALSNYDVIAEVSCSRLREEIDALCLESSYQRFLDLINWFCSGPMGFPYIRS